MPIFCTLNSTGLPHTQFLVFTTAKRIGSVAQLRPSSPICGFAIRGLMLCFFVCTSLSRHNSLCPLCAIHKGKLHQPSDPPPRLPTEIYLSKTRTMTMDSSSNFSLDQKFQNLSPWTQQRYLFHPKLGHDFLPITMNLSNTKFHARYHIPIYNFYNWFGLTFDSCQMSRMSNVKM